MILHDRAGPRLALLAVDRRAAGYTDEAEALVRRLLGAVRRLAPGDEAMVLPGGDRVVLLVTTPASLAPMTFLSEVLFATSRTITSDVSASDLARLRATVAIDTEAAQELFALSLGIDSLDPSLVTVWPVRQCLAIARGAGTVGPVLQKTVQLALDLRAHVQETAELDRVPPSRDELEMLVDASARAWARWFGLAHEDHPTGAERPSRIVLPSETVGA